MTACLRRYGLPLALVTGVLSCAPAAAQQPFPNHPLRIMVAPGGSGDLMTRLVSKEVSTSIGQPVVVDNKRGEIAGETLAHAAPDGYTLIFASNLYWLRPLLGPVNFNGLRDFAPVTLMTNMPFVVVVHPSVPVRSVAELLALAKARPGELNYGSGGNGTISHLATELFKSMAGVNITHVPYKGAGQAITDLLAGRVQLMITIVPTVTPHIKAGKLRAIAMATAAPYPGFPDLPTVAASGVPGYEYDAVNGLLTRAGTPPPVINRLRQEFVRAINLPEVREQITKSGTEVVTSTPEEFGRKMRFDVATWSKLFKELNITADGAE